MDKLEKLAALLREPSKEMVAVGITVGDDCKESDWDSGGDGESYNSYEYFRSDAPAIIFKAMAAVALAEIEKEHGTE